MSHRAVLLWLVVSAACLLACTEGTQLPTVECRRMRPSTTMACASHRNRVNLCLRGGGDGDEEEADEGAGGGEDADEGEEEVEDEDAGPMTIHKALKQVLYYSRIHLGLAKGVKEVIQALLRGEAQLVVLAEDCDEEKYVKVVEGLSAEKGVYLLKVPSRDKLGEWAGQVKLDEDGKPRKICGSSSVAVKDFGEQSEGLAFLLDYIKTMSGPADAPAGAEEEQAAA